MDEWEKVRQLLRAHGAVRLRCKKHEIWQLPGGRKFAFSATPSDRRAVWNAYSQARRLLGLSNHAPAEPGPRRPRRRREKRPVRWAEVDTSRARVGPTLQDQLTPLNKGA